MVSERYGIGMNVFKEMALSIYSYGSYREFLKNKKGKVFGFGMLLILFYFLISMFIPFMINVGTPSGLTRQAREIIPDFELKNGTLWVDGVFELEEAGTYVCIDTDPGSYFYSAREMEPLLRGYSSVIMMDSEKMILKSNGEVQELYFSDLDLDFDKEDLLAYIPTLYVIIVAGLIFAYFWMAALFFFGVLFVALLAMIVNSAMHYKLTFGQLYLLGVYSRTLPLIIKAIVSNLPFGIPFFWVINFGLSVLIIGMAIKKMKEQEEDQMSGYNNPTGYNM